MKVIFILTSLILSIGLYSQISISNIYFYGPNDTISQSTDNVMSHVTITPTSTTSQSWDFSLLKKTGTKTEIITKVESTDSFKSTFQNAKIKRPANGIGMEYFEISSTEVKAVGLVTTLLNQKIAQTYNGSRTLQFAPLTMNASKNSTVSFGVSIPLNTIPGLDSLLIKILPQLGGFGGTLDSIRFSIVTNSKNKVDAFGKMKTPWEKDLDILRIAQENRTSSKIEIKLKVAFGFAIWIDATSFLPIPLPKDTSFVFTFLSNKVKDPIVVVNTNSIFTPTTIAFRSQPTEVIAPDTSKNAISIVESPFTISLSESILEIKSKDLSNQSMISIYDFSGKTLLQHRMSSVVENISLKGISASNVIVIVENSNSRLFKQFNIQD
jgi:hypothetical protein